MFLLEQGPLRWQGAVDTSSNQGTSLGTNGFSFGAHKGSAQQKTVFCPHLPVVNIMTHLVKVWAKLCGDGDYPSRQHQLCLFLAQQLVLSGHIEIQVSCGGPQGWGQGFLRCRGTPSVKPMSVWRLYSCSFFFLSLSFSFSLPKCPDVLGVWVGPPCGEQLGARKAGPSQIKGDFHLINHFMETQHVSCASLPFIWTCVERGWDQEGNSKFIIKILSVKKLEIELSYNPAIPLLGIHTEENRIERDTCTPMVITALFK